MEKTPKSMRLQIGIFGRTNVGKSSFLNMVTGQDVSITSPVPGTTTDVVEKTMEFHGLGPVVFLDTAGVNDDSQLGQLRLEKAQKIIHRSDMILLVVEPNIWSEFEERIIKAAQGQKTPVMAVINKTDILSPTLHFVEQLKGKTVDFLSCSSIKKENRESYIAQLEKMLMGANPKAVTAEPHLIQDLVEAKGLALLVTPIDIEAPKGRLKMLQVQAIRELLDHDKMALTVKETEYMQALMKLEKFPDLVVCDSPVVGMIADKTPKSVPCTTFSILMARYKGDLLEQVKGVAAIDRLGDGDKVLIAEACSHHAIDEDIGRVKIPNAIKQRTGKDIQFNISPGRDYPGDVADYKLIIHCGACMLTRKEMLLRIAQARAAGVAITNYGVCLAFLQGVLARTLSPFEDMLAAYFNEIATGEINYHECVLS